MKKIVIATHLKPLDDQRHYHKLAHSLAKTNKYEINIIGIGIKKTSGDSRIILHPIPKLKNKILNRATAPWRIAKKTTNLKPDLVIINHPELLLPMAAFKSIYGGKLVYDVQENYYLNLIHQQNYSKFFSTFFATTIRGIEKMTSPFVDHFVLAEAVYKDQFGFAKNKHSILQNMAVRNPSLPKKRITDLPQKFIFTGNISTNSGADQAASLFMKLAVDKPKLELTIIGHCPSASFRKYMENEYGHNPAIKLELHGEPVEYHRILKVISDSDLGIIAYKENNSNLGKIPTKYFEYNAYGLPYLVAIGSSWAKLNSNLAIAIDYSSPNVDLVNVLWKQMIGTKMGDDSHFYWDTQEEHLNSLISHLLK